MRKIIVLGGGCSKCDRTADLIRTVAQEENIEVHISKETNAEVIMNHGVMSTPAVVLDDQVMHAGSIPGRSLIKEWLRS